METVHAHEIIKQLRLERGLSQRELADKIGLTQQAIALLENGKRKLEFDLFVDILEELGTTNEELSKIINLIFSHKSTNLLYIDSATIEINFDSDEEATSYLEIIGNLNKMNIDGIKEIEHYTKYLLSNSKYTKSDDLPEE